MERFSGLAIPGMVRAGCDGGHGAGMARAWCGHVNVKTHCGLSLLGEHAGEKLGEGSLLVPAGTTVGKVHCWCQVVLRSAPISQPAAASLCLIVVKRIELSALAESLKQE